MNPKDFSAWTMNYNADYYYRFLQSKGLKNSALIRLLDYAIDPTCDNPFQVSLRKATRFYRARIVNFDEYIRDKGIHVDEKGRVYGFNKENSIEPPLGTPKAGRNNIKGASYLYLANDPETACAEVRANNNEVVSVASFISQRDLILIDFCHDVTIPSEYSKDLQVTLPVFFTKLMNNFRIPFKSDDDYVLTQTITDYVRKAGFDGIAYRSSLTDKPCYTIFHSHHSIIEYESSTLYLPVATIHKYAEINSGEISTAELSVSAAELPVVLNRTKESIKKILDNSNCLE